MISFERLLAPENEMEQLQLDLMNSNSGQRDAKMPFLYRFRYSFAAFYLKRQLQLVSTRLQRHCRTPTPYEGPPERTLSETCALRR